VGAKAEIFDLMAQQARRGLAVLFATSEVAEALNVPDRVLVMAKGRIVRELRRGAATREELMVASGETQRGEGGDER
jgi:erythritol transport system ATP-binding protein